MRTLSLPRLAAALATALLAVTVASAAPTVVKPFAASPDYIKQGAIYGAKTGTHRSVITTRFEGSPTVVNRALSVNPAASLNGDPARANADNLGPQTLPPVFGGYSMIMYGMKEPTLFTVRPQFQNASSKGNDFINFNVYIEDTNPQPAGVEFRFVGAWLFPAGDAGAPRTVPLDKIADVSFFTASQRTSAARLAHVLVRDADAGNFYVSETFTTENAATLDLAGIKWAKLSSDDLTLLGDFQPAPFRRVDHLGVYVNMPVFETNEPVPSFGVICNVAILSLEYTLLP